MSDRVRAKAGDQASFERIVERHAAMIGHFARKFYAPGLTRDDLLQEGRLGLFKAVRDYKPTSTASFETFAAMCVERQIITAVKAATRKKHEAVNGAADIDDPDSPARNVTVADAPSILIERERFGQLLRALKWDLSPLERKAIWLIEAEGLSYELACEVIGGGIGEKVLDNALQRARKKLGVVDSAYEEAVQEGMKAAVDGELCRICLDVRTKAETGFCDKCAEEMSLALESLANV